MCEEGAASGSCIGVSYFVMGAEGSLVDDSGGRLSRPLLPSSPPFSVSLDQVQYLVEEARRGGVQGHRAELFAVKVRQGAVPMKEVC